MADQLDQKQPATMLAFQEALMQASELWDKTPVSILDQQAVQTHALLLAMSKYITYRTSSPFSFIGPFSVGCPCHSSQK